MTNPNDGFAQVVAPYITQRHPVGQAALPPAQNPTDMDALVGGPMGIQLNAGAMNDVYSQSLSSLTQYYNRWLSEGVDLAGPVLNPRDQQESEARKTFAELLQAHRMTRESLAQGKEAQDYLAKEFVAQRFRPGDDVRGGEPGRPLTMDDAYGGTQFMPNYVTRYNQNTMSAPTSIEDAKARRADYENMIAYIDSLGLQPDETERQKALLNPPVEYDDRLNKARIWAQQEQASALRRSNRGGSGDDGGPAAFPEVGALLNLFGGMGGEKGTGSSMGPPNINPLVQARLGTVLSGLGSVEPGDAMQGYTFHGTASGGALRTIKERDGNYVMVFTKPENTSARGNTLVRTEDGTAVVTAGGEVVTKKDGTIEVIFSKDNLLPALAATMTENRYKEYVSDLRSNGFLDHIDQLTEESAYLGFLSRVMSPEQIAEIRKRGAARRTAPAAPTETPNKRPYFPNLPSKP